MIILIPIEPLSQAHGMLIVDAFNRLFVGGLEKEDGWGGGCYGYSDGYTGGFGIGYGHGFGSDPFSGEGWGSGCGYCSGGGDGYGSGDGNVPEEWRTE
jgi:hypothetical protein